MKLELNKIYNEDCAKGLKKLEETSVDLIIADPPFNISFQKLSRENLYNRKKDRIIDGYVEITSDYEEFCLGWISESYRVLKDSGSFFVISGFNKLGVIINCLEKSGFTILNHIIWQYQFPPNTKKKFVTSHYTILFCCKNPKKHKFNPYCRFDFDATTAEGKKAHYQDRSSVWPISRENWAGYKTTKTRLPKALVKKIIEYGSERGDLVVDCFVGSGQGPYISREIGRDYIGFEISRLHFEFAKERLRKNQYKIPA